MYEEGLSVTDFEEEYSKLHDIAVLPARKLDNQLRVRFYKHAELNSFRSKVEGRKIFEDCIYVEILTPANLKNIINRKATEDDKVRFAAQYTRFLQGMEQLSVGTPISELAGLTTSQIMELRALKVETIEQLAGLPDTTAQILGVGGQTLKQRAIRYMDKTADLTEQGAQIRDLQAQLAALLEERQAERKAIAARPEEVKVTEATQAKA